MSKINSTILLWLSITSSLLVLLLQLVQWKLVEIFTPFVMPVVYLAVYGFFLVVLIMALIDLIRRRNWKAIGVQAAAIVLLFIVPFNQIVLDMDFNMNKSERLEVVAQVEDGSLQSNVVHNSSLIRLPKEYSSLSNGGGEIVVEKHENDYSVLFFTFRGILDGFSGFVYSNEKPGNNAFGGDIKVIEKMDEDWYFITSY
ncbi:hypothetical protein P6709_06765 [Jeotgalibacillus sp. ET6]|uniref:hypothetical protein n=1 Tax=Jeotgalibacillus sp. ET6 TaxID=3037260 RepID=UPI0024186BF9|nr:hypothetical protein [Jeotgalibacillus sp. ET6]MDG5471443.1 hypothetical protein [Jeotgalibacillus sp. ET6]